MKPFGRTFEWDYCYFSILQTEISIFSDFFPLAAIKSESVNLVLDLLIFFLDSWLPSGEIDGDHGLFAHQWGHAGGCLLKNRTKMKQLQDHINVIISPLNDFLKCIFSSF